MTLKYPMYHQLLSLLIFVYRLSATTGDQVISYAELQQLNVACPPYDTCRTEQRSIDDDFASGFASGHTCECDEYCTKYQSCCVDSPYRDLQNTGNSPNRVACYMVRGSYMHTFVVTTCDPEWSGDVNIKSLCEDEPLSLLDPITQTPATNNRSGMVYKNYFCAMCNDDLKDLKMWDIILSKRRPRYPNPYSASPFDVDLKEDEVIQKLVYEEAYDMWGVYLGQENRYFYSLTVGFASPSTLFDWDRLCIPNIISDCDVKWTNETVRRKCHAYMAAVYASVNGEPDSRNIYRNIHCAICNYAVVDDAICWKGFPRHSQPPPISFALLLDVNPEDGKFVGRVSRCKEGESYDEFFKKCRTLACALPGYTMVNDKCTKP